jgi:hypothetical protein
MHGTVTLGAEVTNVSKHCVWLPRGDARLAVPFADFPCFRKATIGQVSDVRHPTQDHLYWPQLEADFFIETIRKPETLRLVSRSAAEPFGSRGAHKAATVANPSCETLGIARVRNAGRERMHRQFRQRFLHALAAATSILLSCNSSASPTSDLVAALSEEKRQILFAKLMKREGKRCPVVNKTFSQGKSKDGTAFWSISCTGGKDWQIVIKNASEGEMTTLDCAFLKAVGGDRCFTKIRK